MSINKVILLGNLGHDVSYREFENGQVAQFSVATTEKGYKTKDGKDIPDKTEWHNVVLVGGLAKVANMRSSMADRRSPLRQWCVAFYASCNHCGSPSVAERAGNAAYRQRDCIVTT